MWDNFKTYGQELAVMLIQFLQYLWCLMEFLHAFSSAATSLFSTVDETLSLLRTFFSANSPISRAVFILDTTSATVTAGVGSGLLSEAAVEGLKSTFLAGARISSPCSAFHCLIVPFRLFSASLVCLKTRVRITVPTKLKPSRGVGAQAYTYVSGCARIFSIRALLVRRRESWCEYSDSDMVEGVIGGRDMVLCFCGSGRFVRA